MTRDLFTTLLLLLFSLSLGLAQDFTISGSIVDSEEQPVVLANIILLTDKGEFIKGTVTNDEGFYVFKSVVAGEYSVAASYIETTVESPAFKVIKDVELQPLKLNNAQMLDEVVVTHQKPTVEHLADRHIFNIENTALSEGDIWDVLKRTPGVMVMNNKLYINGSAKVSIMINGKRINLPEEDIINLLTGNSASNVESIEVITSPPAKYSAEGGLVLDIKMKKNLVSGYNGAVFNRYTQGVLPKHTVGMDHFFKGKKIDFSTNYSFSHNRNWARYTEITNFFEEGQENERWTAEQKSITKEKKHNLNLFLDVQLNDKNTLSITSNGGFTPNKARQFSSQTDITDLNGELTAQLAGLNTLDNNVFNASNYIDWVHKINDDGATLSTNAHFTYYDNKRDQTITNDIVEGDSEFTSENTLGVSSNQIINLYSLQTDLTWPFNKTSTLETGLRLATINSEAGILQQGFDTEVDGVDPTGSGVFNYDEQIYAGYVSLNNNWEKWKLNVGLRGEYTDSKGTLSTGANTTSRSYFNVFPSLSLSYTIEKNAFYLKSFRRITRPRYGDINPFQFYYSANSIEEGNPNLKPAYSDYLQLDYVFDKAYKLVLFASKKSNEQSQQIFQDNATNILRTQYINLETNYYYGVDASVSKNLTSYWRLFFLISHYYDKDSFRDTGTGLLVENEIWTTHTRATNSFTLLSDKSLFADLTFTHFTPRISGNAKFESFSKLGLAFRKTLWNKAASLSLAVEDIFNNGNYNSARNYLDQRNSISSRWENRLFVLGFRYKFGNTKIRDNYKRKNTDEGRRL
ncbi:TonB-dependent receptor domain-containing protein [Maribacter sp. LLG6340-A2]|uniref:TonB-dependent receptor domain-containing protein n=1 Tax=Maribacter sp. LLG6340-A2 TaxID=3160834 RepID=UPI003865EB90